MESLINSGPDVLAGIIGRDTCTLYTRSSSKLHVFSVVQNTPISI